MQAKRVAQSLTDPRDAGWAACPTEALPLSAAKLGDQPSRYVRTSWADREFGLVRDIVAQVAHDGDSLYLRLEWASPTLEIVAGSREKGDHPVDGPDAFPDAVAAMFPRSGDAQIAMGNESAPVDIWYWSSLHPEAAQRLEASGMGTVAGSAGSAGSGDTISARSVEDGTKRQVVLWGPLAGNGNAAVNVGAGGSVKLSLAAWAGANGERGGIKSVLQRWVELGLEE